MIILEWLAAALVSAGVLTISWGFTAPAHQTLVICVGTALLTIGVRLAIDCGKRGGR